MSFGAKDSCSINNTTEDSEEGREVPVHHGLAPVRRRGGDRDVSRTEKGVPPGWGGAGLETGGNRPYLPF